MKKSKRSRNYAESDFEEDRAMRELSNMKHRDLQIACIVRGLPSDDVVNFNHHSLVSWFIKHYDNTQDETRLILHDAWIEEKLEGRPGFIKGQQFLHPALKFARPGNIAELPNAKVLDVRPLAKALPEEVKKPRAKMNEEIGVREGTKKALTFSLTLQGKAIEEIRKLVLEKFPDAQVKSINIWHKKCQNAQRNLE